MFKSSPEVYDDAEEREYHKRFFWRRPAGSTQDPQSALHSVKFGVEGLTKALAWQMKPYGICVNAIDPGRMNTDLHRYSPPESKTDMRPPDDIKRLAVFLALQTVDTMTGESIALREREQGKT